MTCFREISTLERKKGSTFTVRIEKKGSYLLPVTASIRYLPVNFRRHVRHVCAVQVLAEIHRCKSRTVSEFFLSPPFLSSSIITYVLRQVRVYVFVRILAKACSFKYPL
jgi:hypothetical protein